MKTRIISLFMIVAPIGVGGFGLGLIAAGPAEAYAPWWLFAALILAGVSTLVFGTSPKPK